MEIEKNLVEHVSRILYERNKSARLSALSNCTNGLKPKLKKYIKKTGWKNFITSHPNEFAYVDDCVILLQDPSIARTTRQTRESAVKPASSSSKKENFTPPSKETIENIKRDIKESKSCMVCSDPMEVFAIGGCFHPICFKCSTKLRVLCMNKQCPICRITLSKVMFTKTLAPENELNISSFIKEQKHGLLFESTSVRNEYRVLLEHRCPKSNCNIKYDDFDDLRTHLQRKHGEYFCDLCVKQCKKFTHERETFSTMELRKHEGNGDANDVGGKGHPLCPFCQTRYLDRDELSRHLQQHHCSCHLCPDESYVFYSDLDQLWNDHHIVTHHVCEERDCHGVVSSVFRTEEELKEHIKQRHSWYKPTAVKRPEQHIALDVTYGSQQNGLQFSSAPSASQGFQLSPIRGSAMAPVDGYLRCYGRVISINTYCGFIERDDCRGKFEENIFFNQQSCALECDEDLRLHFEIRDRVIVHAMKADRNHRSKWRAIDVTKIEDSLSEVDAGSVRTRTISGSSSMTDCFETAEVPSLEGSFPALPTNGNGLAMGANSSNNPTDWSTVVKANKKTTKTTNISAPKSSVSTTGSSVRKTPPKGEKQVELEGVGLVHPNLDPTFGFITRQTNSFEDNIYFNIQAYRVGSLKFDVKDLCKELKIGEKVNYRLQEPGKIVRNTKSKYRAIHVWKYNQTNNEPTERPQASSSKPSIIPGLQPPQKKATEKAKPTPIQPVTSGKKKKNKGKENIAPKHNGTATTSAAIKNPVQPVPTSPSFMSLDTFESPLTNLTIKRSLSCQVEEIFRNLLVDITGASVEDVMFEFDQELAINDVKLSQIAFVRFSRNEHPKIHSVLLPACDTNGYSSALRHRHFSLPCVSGFKSNAISSLREKGSLVVNDDTLYYVNKSNFYITLRKDEKGVPVQLFLHTPFNAITTVG